MHRSKDLSRIRRLTGLSLLALALILGPAACDKADNDWQQPADPDPVGQPALTLTMEGGGSVNVGVPSTFTVSLANNGLGAADSVAVAVTLPADLTLDLAQTDAGEFDGALGHWTMTDLAVSATVTLSLDLTAAAGAMGQELTLQALVLHVDPEDSTPANHEAEQRVTVMNNPPVAGDDAYTLDEGGAMIIEAPGVLGNDSDPEGETITLQIEPVLEPAHGSVAFHATGAFAYAHDGSEAVADSFRYVITDASAESDTAMVRITVEPVNDAPVVDAPESYDIFEGGTFAPIDLDLLVSDADHDVADLVWDFMSVNDLSVELSDDRILTVTTPGPDWFGADGIIFQATDPDGGVSSDPVLFTVTGVNDAPVTSPLPSQTIPVGGVFLSIPLDNYVADVDHDDAEQLWTVTGEQPLLVNISADRVLSVQSPSPTWTGSVTMTLRVTDPEGDWDERDVRFEVTLAK